MAYVFFKRRPKAAKVEPAAVTITGTGNSTYCYTLINGTTYTSAASGVEVMPGDVIKFVLYGYSATYYGALTIDGTQALRVTDRSITAYDWTVPEGITTITISMTYTSTTTRRNGRITVTTS